MQESLSAVICEETAIASILLKVFEEEHLWLVQGADSGATPFLEVRQQLLSQLRSLGQRRLNLLRDYSPQANEAMAKLADVILRIQELSQRNETLLKMQMNNLEQVMAEEAANGRARKRQAQPAGAA